MILISVNIDQMESKRFAYVISEKIGDKIHLENGKMKRGNLIISAPSKEKADEYIKQLDKPINPLPLPVCVNNKGRLTLPSVTTTFFY